MINKSKEMIRCNVTFHLVSKSTQNKDFLIQVTLPKFSCHSSEGEANKSFKNLETEELMWRYKGLRAVVSNLGCVLEPPGELDEFPTLWSHLRLISSDFLGLRPKHQYFFNPLGNSNVWDTFKEWISRVSILQSTQRACESWITRSYPRFPDSYI